MNRWRKLQDWNKEEADCMSTSFDVRITRLGTNRYFTDTRRCQPGRNRDRR
jgi:hypothetical protein